MARFIPEADRPCAAARRRTASPGGPHHVQFVNAAIKGVPAARRRYSGHRAGRRRERTACYP